MTGPDHGRGRLAEGVTLGKEIARLIPQMLPITTADALRAGDILLMHPQLSPHEALHAATALNTGISELISVDPDFDAIEEINRVDPGR